MDPCGNLSKWSRYAPGGDKRAVLPQWTRYLPSPPDIISLQEVQCMWDSEASGWFQSSGYRVKVSTGTNRSCGCAVSVTMRVVSFTIPSNKKMTDSKQNSLCSRLKLLLFFEQLYQVILIGSQWSHAWISKRSKANRRSVVHTG